MAVRDEIVWRSGIVYFFIAVLAVALLVRILILQYVQHGKWADMSEKYVFKTAEAPILSIWIPEAPVCQLLHGQQE